MPRSFGHFVRVYVLWYNIWIHMKHMDEMDVEISLWYNIWIYMEHMDEMDVEISL